MSEIVDTAFDKRRYQEGRALALNWIAGGGDLMADPPASDEAYENGFADTLAEARRTAESISSTK